MQQLFCLKYPFVASPAEASNNKPGPILALERDGPAPAKIAPSLALIKNT
jgi:hypothetical protein